MWSCARLRAKGWSRWSLTHLVPSDGKTAFQKQTCECDRTAALCFRRNLATYNDSYAHYPNKLCSGPTPPC